MTEITAHHGLFKVTNLHVHDTGGSGRPVVLVLGWPLSGKRSASRCCPWSPPTVTPYPQQGVLSRRTASGAWPAGRPTRRRSK